MLRLYGFPTFRKTIGTGNEKSKGKNCFDHGRRLRDRLELQQLKKDVKVTTVNPYYIDSGMFKGVRSKVPVLKQEKVAEKIIKAIEKEKIFLTMPWSTRFVRLSHGILPLKMYDWITGRVLGI